MEFNVIAEVIFFIGGGLLGYISATGLRLSLLIQTASLILSICLIALGSKLI